MTKCSSPQGSTPETDSTYFRSRPVQQKETSLTHQRKRQPFKVGIKTSDDPTFQTGNVFTLKIHWVNVFEMLMLSFTKKAFYLLLHICDSSFVLHFSKKTFYLFLHKCTKFLSSSLRWREGPISRSLLLNERHFEPCWKSFGVSTHSLQPFTDGSLQKRDKDLCSFLLDHWFS